MAKAREVTIIGAGPVGLVASLYLARKGFEVTVYEGRPDPRKIRPIGGRSINLTIAARGWKAFADVGVESAVRAISLPLRGRMIHREDGSSSAQPYGARGEALYAVSRAQLTRTLTQAAEGQGSIKLAFGHRLLQLDPEMRLLEFERPERGTSVNLRATTILAADGCYSAARPSLLRSRAVQYEQTYSHHWYKELHIPSRAGWCLDPERTHVWPRQDAILVAFPNLNRSFTASLFLPAEGERSFRALRTREDLVRLFETTFPDVLPLSPDLDFAFFSKPIGALVSMRCRPWVYKGNVALIGDAAHSMVPFLGQGMNAGLEDCTVLAETLDETDRHWEATYERYQERRKPDCDVVTTLAEDHFESLAVGIDDPTFHLRSRIEQRLHAEHPEQFIPIYTLLSFTCLPYSTAPAIAERQAPLIAELSAIDDVEAQWHSKPVRDIIASYLANAPRLPLGAATRFAHSDHPSPMSG